MDQQWPLNVVWKSALPAESPVHTNLPSVPEAFLGAGPEEQPPQGEGEAVLWPWVDSWPPGHAVSRRHTRQVWGEGDESPVIWTRSTRHPPESHRVGAHRALRIAVRGVPAGLCPFLLGHAPCLPGSLPPAPGPPPAPRPRSRTGRCRSGWWLAPGNWPALSPRNSADTLGALKWANKV